MRLPAGTTIVAPDGTSMVLERPAVFVPDAVCAEVGPTWVEVAGRRERVDGWSWSAATRKVLQAIADLSGEVRRGTVPSPSADGFRPRIVESVGTVTVAEYAEACGISTSMARRRCRDGKVPGAVRDGWAWSIPA